MVRECALKDYIWRRFELTGGIDEYMFYKEIDNVMTDDKIIKNNLENTDVFMNLN